MTRSLAPRPRTQPARKRTPPDPNAVFHWRCVRCSRLIWCHGVATECHSCINAAVKVFGLGPINGEASGT